MARRIDREIEVWSRKSVRAQLSLLWDDAEVAGVRTFAYWEKEDWGSPFVIYASQARRGRGRWHAHCFVHFGRPEDNEVFLSTDQEHPGRPGLELHRLGARDIRRLLEVPGVEEREELAGLLTELGYRRDEMDIPTFRQFAGHRDEIVRYVSLAMLSWQPSISNRELLDWFGEDADPVVRGLTERMGSGRVRRRTRT